MKRPHEPFPIAAVLVSLLTAACGSSSSSPPPSVTCTNGTIEASEGNNYLFTNQITLDKVKVKSMSDLMFDWSGVTKDFLGHQVNPVTDLNTVLLLLVDMPVAMFESQLANDTFSEMDVVVQPPPLFSPMNGETSADLFTNFMAGDQQVSLANAGMYLNASTYPPSTSTFAFAVQSGQNLGFGIKMLQAFDLDDSSTNTKITVTNTSTKLSFHADLHSQHPTGVPAGTPALTLDWGTASGIAKNALGNDFDPTQITHAIVGHYTQPISQLESQFLDLQTIAADLYEADIQSGTVLDFTMLKDKKGAAFPGVSSDGTWLVGLFCGLCRSPAPWYMTVLVPAPQPCAP